MRGRDGGKDAAPHSPLLPPRPPAAFCKTIRGGAEACPGVAEAPGGSQLSGSGATEFPQSRLVAVPLDLDQEVHPCRVIDWSGVDDAVPMDDAVRMCALCGKAVGGAEPAHAVRDKFICEACRGLVIGSEPRPVLPYADHRGRRRRRWLWPAVAGAAVVAIFAASLGFTAWRAAAARARDEQLRAAAVRALAAERSARAEAEAARERLAQTRPAE